jgi:DNA repair exonuclease SbcCD ATPase subunit
MAISDLRNKLEQFKGQQKTLISQRDTAIKKSTELSVEISATEEAKAIIQAVAKKTQDKLRSHIEEPVSLAMAAVFDDPYELRLDMVERRGRTECDLIFTKGGKDYDDLMFSGGGGPVDVAAFGLQIAVLAFMKHHARPLLILDEPLKWLKGGELPERGAMMISQVAKELGITVIMVSHIPEQKAGADKLFHVTMGSNRVSKVKEEIN